MFVISPEMVKTTFMRIICVLHTSLKFVCRTPPLDIHLVRQLSPYTIESCRYVFVVSDSFEGTLHSTEQSRSTGYQPYCSAVQ
jgi:hypothetical protein